MEKLAGELVVWCLFFFILVGVVVLLLATFTRRDSLRYDNEWLWGNRSDLKDKPK